MNGATGVHYGRRASPLAADVDWTRLSSGGRSTLREVALPVSAGATYSELAVRLGVTEGSIMQRMKRLRDEIRAQVGATGCAS